MYSKNSCEFTRYYYSTITYYTELCRVWCVDELTTIIPHARVLKNNQEITSMNGTKKTYSGRLKKYENSEIVCDKITTNNVILAV